MFQFLEHQHAGAARDDEAVAVGVIGAGGPGGGVVVLRRHGAHGVEQDRERPVEVFAAAREDDVLAPALDHLGGVADAVVRGRAGGRDRVVHALDLEPGRERRGGRRGHGLGHREGADALRALLAGDGGGFDDHPGRGTARAHYDAGAVVRDVALLEPRIADRLIHGDVVPGGAAAVEAHGAPVDHALRVEARCALDLAAEAVLGVGGRADDAGPRFPQRGQHLLGVVADG
ncbi:hypothetical protein AEGHOMDF_4792 [Methylobacterium soli]|nr:hypothetical protein AEGHOMDF_4792 [Methylobacterium soli]